MALDAAGFGSYALEAFNRKVRVPLLGDMPLNKMVLGASVVLGLVNPGFWFLGAAGELAYLFLKATSPRFQKLIEGERLLAQQETWAEKVNHAVESLSPASRERYRKLLGQCRLTLGVSDTLETDTLGNFRDLRARNLNQLLAIFLRLLTSKEAIESNLSSLDAKDLALVISHLEARLATAEPEGALHRSLSGTLDIQRKRLENLERARNSLAVINAELERIEQQIELIREESAVSGRPEMLSMRLDAVTSTMSETSRWMDEHGEFFESLAGQDLVGHLSQLPELPAALAEEPPPPADDDRARETE